MAIQNWDSLVKERSIFIIHGHDESNLIALERLLKQKFRMNSVILNRIPDRGRTIIEKFEQEAENCCYAVVLLTPDDHVRCEEGEVWQPRQNVMFELDCQVRNEAAAIRISPLCISNKAHAGTDVALL